MTILHMERTAFGEDSVNELVYLMQFADHAEMEAKWAAFLTDPDWIEARTASEADGPLVRSVRRRIIDPAPFTRAVTDAGWPAAGPQSPSRKPTPWRTDR